jgi:hypothetical protein
MRELLKFRNLKEHYRATVAECCRTLPPLPSPRFTPHRALLGCAVTLDGATEGPRDLSDVTCNNTQRYVLRMSDSSVHKRDWRQCSSSRVPVVFMRVQVRVRNEEFTTSSQWVIGVSWEDCFCDKNIYVEYSECETVTVVATSVAKRRLVEIENSSACATVSCNWCKGDIALYCLCASVIMSECNQLLINPVIRTRTRLFSGVHVTIFIQ